MAELALPKTNYEAILMDYRDKHEGRPGFTSMARKFSIPKRKDKQEVLDTNGDVVTTRTFYTVRQQVVKSVQYVNAIEGYSQNPFYNDCYASVNHFGTETKSWKRDKGNLSSLNGFFFDFDSKEIHEYAKNQEALPMRDRRKAPKEMVDRVYSYKEEIIKVLRENLLDDFGMPVVTFTGGGFALYFPLNPIKATKKNQEAYMQVWNQLYERLSELFADLLGVFENDHTVVDVVRVMRVAGTYNYKTGTYAEYVARYGSEETGEVYRYDLEDIVRLYYLDGITVKNEKKVSHSLLLKKEKEKREEKEEASILNREKSVAKYVVENYENIQEYKPIKEFVKKDNTYYVTKWFQEYVNIPQITTYIQNSIKSMEYKDSNGTLERNNALFMIACFKTEIEYAKYGCYIFDEVEGDVKESIVEYVYELNESLHSPLEDDEFYTLMKSALSNQYHFRKYETMQKFLGLTSEEFSNLGWMKNQENEASKKERSEEDVELDKKAMKLYLSGMSDEKVGKQLGIPKLKVVRTRKRLGVTNRSIKFKEIDFEGNRRHLKHKTNEQKPLTTICERNTIPEEQVVKRFPKKYSEFFASPIESITYFVKHNEKYSNLSNREKQEVIKAYYINKRRYMVALGIGTPEAQQSQLRFLRKSTNHRDNLAGNVAAILENESAASQFRSGKLATLTIFGSDGKEVVTQVTEQDLYRAVYGEHLNDRVV